MSEDSDLRERFESLRRENAGRAPGFAGVLQRAPRAPASRPGALAAAACIVLIIGIALLYPRVHAPRPLGAAAPSLADWRSPMDFLLNTPAQEVLRNIPEIGGVPPAIFGIPQLDHTTATRPSGEEQS